MILWHNCRIWYNRLPVKYFTDRSEAVLLLWILYVFVLSCVCYVFVRVCLYVLCGHLLGKGWPLGSRLWCLTMSLSLSHWYPGSGVVLDCIDSWSLHPYLLFFTLSCSLFSIENSRNYLFIATIQICNELLFLCLQNYFGLFQTFVKLLGSLISNFNIKQEDSWVLGRSPDMTIRKVRWKLNHSPTLQLSISNRAAVLIRLCF